MKLLPHTLSALALAAVLSALQPFSPSALCSDIAPAPDTPATTTESGADSTTITGTIAVTAPPINVPELSKQILDRSFAPAPGFEREAMAVATLFEQGHYNRNAVKPADYASVIPDFMDRWDSQRIFFLQSDKDAFTQRYSARWIYNNLLSLGKTDPGYEMFSVYQKRVVDRVSWILDRLTRDIDLTGHDIYLYDRKDAPWPADAAAADALWEQRLKNELITEILNNKKADGEKIPDDKVLADAKTAIRKRYERFLKNFSEWEAKDVSESYLTVVGHLYDPHTDYWSAETNDEFNVQMTLQLIGIGAQLNIEDDYCTIQEIIVGGPADLEKQLQPKDKIIAVAQDGEEPVDVIGMRLNKVVQLIRGKKGTTVHLTVIPASDPTQRKEIAIVRDVVNVDSSRARGAIYDVPNPDGAGTTPIGVITLPSFYGEGKDDKGRLVNSTSQDVATLIDKFQAAPGGIKGLVIDLRGNGGGFLSEAIALGGLFVKSGPIVQVKDSSGNVQVQSSAAPEPKYTGPLVMLVNHFSASASEIVAGAMQKYGRAIVIGDSATHGKGTVQTVFPIKNYAPMLARLNPRTGSVHFTIQKFYLPDGDSTQIKGVVSDIVLPNIDDIFPIYEKDMPHALAWDEIPASKFDGHLMPPEIIAALRAASEKRQDTLEEFAYLRKGNDRFATQYKDKTISLNLDDRRAQKDADKTFNKDQDIERDRLAKTVGYNSTEFLVVPDKPKNRTAETDAAEKKKQTEEKKAEEFQQSGATAAPSTDNTDIKHQPDDANQNAKTDETAATADDDTEDDGSGLTPDELDSDAKKMDISLREAMRVLLDKIAMEQSVVPATNALATQPAK